MKSNRLWPVLTVLAVLLVGTGLLEWAAASWEGHYDQVVVAGNANDDEGESEDGIPEPTWQSTAPMSAEHTRARQLLRRGNVDEALEIYRVLVHADRSPVPLLTEYAYVLRRARRCEEAFPVVQRAFEQAPQDGAVNLAVALTHRCLGNTDEAAAAFERALARRPNHTPTRLAYGGFLRRAGGLERAVEVLEPATRRGSNDERAQALAALGRCLIDLGERNRARQALDEAVERAPADVSIWMSVARSYLRSGDQDDDLRALQSAARASRLAPELATPHSVIGRAYEHLGLRLDAIDSYLRAAELDPRYEYPLRRLVRLGLAEEENAIARRSARGLLRIDADNAEYHFLHGLAASRSADLDAARAAYQRAIEVRDGDYAEAWYNLGLLERQAGQPEAAIRAYERALEARPDYAAAWNNLGLVYYDLERYADAESSFRSAIALRDDYAAAWSNLGRTYSTQDQYDLAADAYEQALRVEPSDRTLRLRLAVAYRRTDRLDESILLYRELVADEPRYVSAWYNLGIALANAGQDFGARQAYLTALGIDPNHRRTLKNLGLLEVRMGLREEARTHLTDALDIDPTDHVVRLRLAQLSLESNDLRRCAREARLVLTQAPDSPDAQSLLGRCAQDIRR
jgi:tetratricopeptide (TPR) repeat protein